MQFVATNKRRLNICLPDDVDEALKTLAERDNVSQASRAVQLIKVALEIEEDELWNDLALERDTKGAEYLSHKQIWS